MSNVLELSLSEGYVQHWSWKEAVREILQNALDCKDFQVSYPEGMMSILTIDGAIPRSALLLGESGKRDQDKIGKFGEGLKLALLILAREGYVVEITSGKEKWLPRIAESSVFTGVRTLQIEIIDHPEGDEDSVEINISGLSDDQIDYIEGTYLLEKDIKDRIVAQFDGSTALEPEWNEGDDGEIVRKCKVYCGGLYVCDLEKGYQYSYDIRPGRLTLDRDRNTVMSWDLQFEVVRTLTGAGKADLLVHLAKINAEDVRGYSTASVASGAGYGSSAVKFNEEVTELAVESFKSRYGERAIPFTSGDQDQPKVKMAIRAGYTPVFVQSAEYLMINNKITLPSGLVEVKKPQVIEELTNWIDAYGDTSAGADEIYDLISRLEEYEIFMGLKTKEDKQDE